LGEVLDNTIKINSPQRVVTPAHSQEFVVVSIAFLRFG